MAFNGGEAGDAIMVMLRAMLCYAICESPLASCFKMGPEAGLACLSGSVGGIFRGVCYAINGVLSTANGESVYTKIRVA